MMATRAECRIDRSSHQPFFLPCSLVHTHGAVYSFADGRYPTRLSRNQCRYNAALCRIAQLTYLTSTRGTVARRELFYRHGTYRIMILCHSLLDNT